MDKITAFIPLVDKMPPEYKKEAQAFIKKGIELGYWEKREFGAEAPKPAKSKKKGKAVAPTPLMAYMGKTLYNRRESTQWSFKEAEAFDYLMDCYGDERGLKTDIKLVAKYYEQLQRGDAENNIARRDLLTCLNNWTGEVDRANNYKFPATQKVAMKMDEAPAGWETYWVRYTGKQPNKGWYELSEGIRAEILEGMRDA
jgi:hypothetical protein